MRVLPVIAGLSLSALLALAFAGCGGGGGTGGGTNNGSVTLSGEMVTFTSAGAVPFDVVAYFKKNGTTVFSKSFEYKNGAYVLNLATLNTTDDSNGTPPPPPPPPMFNAYQPDLLIRTDTYIGSDTYEKALDGTYSMEVRKVVTSDGSIGELVRTLEVNLNVTGAQIISTETVAAASQSIDYTVRLENDGSNPDSITVTGTQSDSNWNVQYFSPSGADITAQVTGAGWVSSAIGPLSALTGTLRISVQPTRALANGTKKTVRLTATSVGAPTNVDSVWATTSYTTAP